MTIGEFMLLKRSTSLAWHDKQSMHGKTGKRHVGDDFIWGYKWGQQKVNSTWDIENEVHFKEPVRHYTGVGHNREM